MGIPSEEDDIREDQVEEATGFGSVIGRCPRRGSRAAGTRPEAAGTGLLPICQGLRATAGPPPAPASTAGRPRPPALRAVVANLPVVPQEKYDKLAAVVRKVFGSIGTIRDGAPPARAATRAPMQSSSRNAPLRSVIAAQRIAAAVSSARRPWVDLEPLEIRGRHLARAPAGGFYMPQDASGTTKGFAFIEFASPKVRFGAKRTTQPSHSLLSPSSSLLRRRRHRSGARCAQPPLAAPVRRAGGAGGARAGARLQAGQGAHLCRQPLRRPGQVRARARHVPAAAAKGVQVLRESAGGRRRQQRARACAGREAGGRGLSSSQHTARRGGGSFSFFDVRRAGAAKTACGVRARGACAWGFACRATCIRG